VNFVTCHDGFTLRDLVSYEAKRNESNGHEGRDGTDANWSSNCGVEGPTDADSILRLRDGLARALLATLVFSQGVPMLSHGDEIGRSQLGNNNAYCHDGPLTWVDWEVGPRERELLDFTRQLLAIRRANSVLRRRSFFSGEAPPGRRAKDVTWLRPDGLEMKPEDWEDPKRRVLGMLVEGEASEQVDERGRPIQGDTLLVLFNAGNRPCHFRLPPLSSPGSFELTLSTAPAARRRLRDALNLVAHSAALLTHRRAV
jgi:glycogen operon protein